MVSIIGGELCFSEATKRRTLKLNVFVCVFIGKLKAINIQNYYTKMCVNSCQVIDFLVFS